METPLYDGDELEPQDDVLAASLAVDESRPQVWVSPLALAVWDALCALAGEKKTWRGTQAEIARAAGYSLRAVQGALQDLKAERLVLVDRHGNSWSYLLRRDVDVVAPEAPAPTGRDVVRSAGSFSRPVAYARDDISNRTAETAAAASESEGAPAAPAVASAQGLDRDEPTYSSSSSSSAAAAAAGASPTADPPAPSPSALPRGGLMGSSMPADLSPAEQGAWARLVAYHIAPEPDATLAAITELGPYQERDFWRRIDEHHRPRGSTWTFVQSCVVSALRAWPDEPDGLASFTPEAEAFTETGDPFTTTTPTTAQDATPDDVSREPTQREAKAVWVAEMQRAPRPVLEVTLPPLPTSWGEFERPVVRATEVVLRASRSLVQGFRALRGQRRRPRGGS